MSNSVAEAYLLIVRESMVPVIGEAVPIPFTGQIELDGWDWDLKNEELVKQKEEQEKAAAAAAATQGADATGAAAKKEKKQEPFKGDELIRLVTTTQINKELVQEKRNEKVRELIKKAVDDFNSGLKQDGDKAGADGNKMTLTFEKAVDLASTQLLNAMVKAEIMPRAVLTLFHRSKNAPVTLAITFTDIRLTGYKVSVEPSDTMADMKETWTASYETVGYMYQNRPAASGPNFVTQGTVRVFAMDGPDLPI